MTIKRELPDLQFLHELFLPDYQEGIIYWNERPIHHFCSEKKRNSWNKKYAAKPVGITRTKTGYKLVKIKNQCFSQHRILYYMYHGEYDTSKYLDHINRNPKDNSIKNLRLCTLSDNNCNSPVPKNNYSTGIKNITHTKYDTYLVSICRHNKKICKTLKTLGEAMIYRNKKLAELHGEFACF